MHRPLRAYPAILLLLSLILFAAPALAETEAPPAGSVRSVTGDVQLLRKGHAAAKLAVGDRLYEKDVLVTAKDATAGLVMRDNATLSLGPGTKLTIERYLFEPEKERVGSLLRVSRGSMAMVSGEIAKLKPDAAQVQTPIFTIGIRGTHFVINVPEGLEEEDEAQAAKPGEGR